MFLNHPQFVSKFQLMWWDCQLKIKNEVTDVLESHNMQVTWKQTNTINKALGIGVPILIPDVNFSATEVTGGYSAAGQGSGTRTLGSGPFQIYNRIRQRLEKEMLENFNASLEGELGELVKHLDLDNLSKTIKKLRLESPASAGEK